MKRALLALGLVLPTTALAQASPGPDGTYLIRGGTVITGTGERLANTNVLVRNGRIAQIGPNVTANDAKIVDAKDKFVYPGMIDSYT
ncbi:MAG: amidohydrolase, partial [bacterium]